MVGRLRGDLSGLAVVAGAMAALLAYRAWVVEPRDWAAACAAAAAAPVGCAPRAALLWLQYQGAWGGAALALGLLAFWGAPFGVAVAAVAMGSAGVINYNATFGMLGAVLGAWAWLRRDGVTRRRAAGI